MTSPNEWWKEEPYRTEKSETKILMTKSGSFYADILDEHFDIPAIIEEVKRRESTTVKDMGRGELFARWFKCLSCDSDEIIEDAVFCSHCGLKINWK